MKRFLATFLLCLYSVLGFAQTSPTVQLKTISDLVWFSIPMVNNRLSALVVGYWATNDAAGGIFVYDAASSASTNLGVCFKPLFSNGRWIRQFSGPLNVLHWGARRDRVNGAEPFTGFIGTDSSTNFQNAIDFMQSNTNLYGTLFVPVGHYTWTNTVYLDGAIQLVGEGIVNATEGIGGGANILITATNGTGLIIGARKTLTCDWRVQGISFDGFGDIASYGLQVGDATHESSRGTISKVGARKFNVAGIRIVSGNTVRIEDCDLVSRATNSAALLFDYVTGGTINAITTVGNHIGGGNAGYSDGWKILNGQSILSLGDVIEGATTGTGIRIIDTSANPGRITRCTFVNTWMEQNATNIVAYYPGVSRTIVGMLFTGTQLRGSTTVNQIVVGNGEYKFQDVNFGDGTTRLLRGMTSAIVNWFGTTTNGTWTLDSDPSNPSVVNYETSMTPTITAPGTTATQTINRPTGRVNIVAGGTTVTVNNSLVTANSLVFVTVGSNDATAIIKNVVPGAGSFVITMNAAVTAETKLNFSVRNPVNP